MDDTRDIPDSKTSSWEELEYKDENKLKATDRHTFHIMTEFEVRRKC